MYAHEMRVWHQLTHNHHHCFFIMMTSPGYLIHWFTTAGTYYYSSSFSSPAAPPFRGSIVVTDRDDYLRDVSVSVNDVEAEYDTSAACTTVLFLRCNWFMNIIIVHVRKIMYSVSI